jgi:hypothetical protein
MNAIEFLKRSDGHRVVSTGDLNEYQIAEARRDNKVFVDPDTGLGWVLLPWELTTDKDRERERKYLMKTLPKAVVVNDDNNEQALYVDGLLKGMDSTIYACDIVDEIGDSPFTLSQKNLDGAVSDWPETLAELELN